MLRQQASGEHGRRHTPFLPPNGTLIGIGLGIVSALALARLVASQLYGVPLHDPATLAVAALGVAGIGLLAGYLPARSASRVDAMLALRAD